MSAKLFYMNNDRRKALQKLRELLVYAQGDLQEIKQDLESLRDAEQRYYDNMPENMQSGDKGSKAEENADALDSAVENLGTIDSEINDAITYIDTASE